MVGRLPLEEVEAMPLSALLDRCASWRRVDARRQLDHLNLLLAATRGDEHGVRRVSNALQRAAGVVRHGDVDALAAWLGGGA
jgi:hypothetical protein